MSKTARIIIYLFSIFIFINIGWWGGNFYNSKLSKIFDPLPEISFKPLEKYQVENLSQAEIPETEIKIEKELEKNDKFTSYLINFSFDPTLSGKSKKKVTGLMNKPNSGENFPVIILFRGYVDPSIYQSGVGTKRVGEFFAENGYITIAPDFLGYGGSSTEAGNIFETRFQTYTTALTVIKSVKSISQWNQKDIFIWAHSNGGQVALTSLEASGVHYPTVLWAPVTKPFPYSILYYTDESVDRGKFIRKELAKFESNYDVDKFSMTNYLDKIKAPIQLHQGTSDDAIPVEWSLEFSKMLKNKDVEVEYLTHKEADHNLNPLWNDAVTASLEFFNKYLKSGI